MSKPQQPALEPLVDVTEIDTEALKASTAIGSVKSTAEQIAESVGMVWEKFPKLEVHDVVDQDLPQDVQNLFESIGGSIHDAFRDLFLGIDVSFGDLLKRMAADFAALGIESLFAGLLSAAFPGAGGIFSTLFGGSRAMGGGVEGGTVYQVHPGEAFFTPGRSGFVADANGVGINQTFVMQALSPAQWEALARNAAYTAASVAKQVTEKTMRGRR